LAAEDMAGEPLELAPLDFDRGVVERMHGGEIAKVVVEPALQYIAIV